MLKTDNQQLPKTAPAALNVPAPCLDSEIINLQLKLKHLQSIIEAGPLKDPHLFFYSKNFAFTELTQFHFPFNLSDKILQLASEALQHYTFQLENLQRLKADSTSNTGRNSCSVACTASDYRPGGKCDLNGCFR